MTDFCLAAISTAAGKTADTVHNLVRWIERAAGEGANLILFPEAALTGYALDALPETAIATNAPELSLLQQTARTQQVIVSVGLLTRLPGGIGVTQYLLGLKTPVFYQKCHLTKAEHQCGLVPGETLTPTALPFVRLGTLICYDSAFPQAAETLVRKGAELLFTPSAHSFSADVQSAAARDREQTKRRRHVHLYWRARAYDFSSFAVYVDQAGKAADGSWFSGYAAVFGPDGATLAEHRSRGEGMALARLSADHLTHCREQKVGHYHTLPDARPELYD